MHFLYAGINKGAAIYLHLLRELATTDEARKQIAFFHRNSCEARNRAILCDLTAALKNTKDKLELSSAKLSTRFIFYKNTFYKNNQAQIWKK